MAVILLLALSFVVFFVLRVLLLMFLERLRLKMRGAEAEGVCTGYSSGRYGNGVAIDFEDRDGRARHMVSHSWRGVLPEVGSRVTVVHLPRSPEVSDVAPIRSLVPNALYLAVALPALAAVGASGILLAIHVVRGVWF
ncbi:DUF3592 domain-containing protein [Streptomyces sp. NPDC059142]|uniref:DUF3592 domain-containing protein n=1 Tax=Streptomyces sp. NPDC059142 TaxID=3346739 RepID=UPI00369CA736